MNLSDRDKIALAIGTVVLVVFLAVRFVIFPLLDKRHRMARLVAKDVQTLESMRILEKEYSELRHRSRNLESLLEKRPAGFSLFSFLEKAAADSGVKQNIAYMKPSTQIGEDDGRMVMVEMKLQAIGLKQLVDFLDRSESPENVVTVKRIAIRTNRKAGRTLDVVLQFLSLEAGHRS